MDNDNYKSLSGRGVIPPSVKDSMGAAFSVTFINRWAVSAFRVRKISYVYTVFQLILKKIKFVLIRSDLAEISWNAVPVYRIYWFLIGYLWKKKNLKQWRINFHCLDRNSQPFWTCIHVFLQWKLSLQGIELFQFIKGSSSQIYIERRTAGILGQPGGMSCPGRQTQALRILIARWGNTFWGCTKGNSSARKYIVRFSRVALIDTEFYT